MKKNVKEEMYTEPIKLNEKEIKKLQKQFPELAAERLQNKLEMIALLFWLIMAVGVLYLFYLSWNYAFVGM